MSFLKSAETQLRHAHVTSRDMCTNRECLKFVVAVEIRKWCISRLLHEKYVSCFDRSGINEFHGQISRSCLHLRDAHRDGIPRERERHISDISQSVSARREEWKSGLQ